MSILEELDASTQAFYQQWADMRAERDTAIARALSAEIECKELRTQLFMMTVCAETAEHALIEETAKRVEAEHALAATKAGHLYSDLKVARLKDALEAACKDIIEADLTVWAEAAERDPSRVPAAQPANAEVERRLSELYATKAGLLSLYKSHAYSRQIGEEEEAKERQAREAEERQAREAEEQERCRLASELEASRDEVALLRRVLEGSPWDP